MFDDRLEQRRDVQSVHAFGRLLDLHGLAFIVHLSRAAFDAHAFDLGRIADHDALPGDAVEDREIQLLVIGVQIHEQLVYLVHDLVDPGVFLVDLIDKQNRVEPLFQRLLQYEPGLGHRSFTGIHQQDHGIDGLDDPLDLR